MKRLLLALLVLAVLPRNAPAQGLVPALAGGAGGLLAGGFVSVGIVTAQARFADDYLYSARDALGWEAAPVLLGSATGAVLGATDSERLRGAGLGGLAGLAVGAVVGTTIGAASSSLPEGRWAGGTIGGAAGLVVGAVVGMIVSGEDDTSPDPSGTGGGGVPLGIEIRF